MNKFDKTTALNTEILNDSYFVDCGNSTVKSNRTDVNIKEETDDEDVFDSEVTTKEVKLEIFEERNVKKENIDEENEESLTSYDGNFNATGKILRAKPATFVRYLYALLAG